tara:strand:- start:166 stop:1038 length:873 start_codon:yes stop_codon:yes gene_type:complete
MYYYKCERCNHITKQKVEIKRHLKRKFKCKNVNNFEGNDEKLYQESLTKKIVKDEEEINIKKKEYEIQEIKNENNNEEFFCNKCQVMFSNKSNYNRHLKNNVCQNPTMNITNNTLHQQNNVININLKIIKPFDDDWDVSNIDNTLKNILVLSSMKYTKTLEQLLNNDTNLNVFIDDKNAETGIVYKNDIEKFKMMSIEDIVDKSMIKLNKHLNDFHSEIKEENEFSINQDYLNDEKSIINKKFKEYKNKEIIKEKVTNFLTRIYNSKKEDCVNIFKEIMDEKEKDLIEGY